MVVEHQTIRRLLEYLETTLDQIENMEFSALELLENPDVQDLIDRRLQVAIEACIDIANHVAAGLGLPDRDTSAEVFLTLGKHQIIAQNLAEKFKSIVGLRNILVHRYAAIDHSLILKDYKNDLEDLRSFAKTIVLFLEKNPQLG